MLSAPILLLTGSATIAPATSETKSEAKSEAKTHTLSTAELTGDDRSPYATLVFLLARKFGLKGSIKAIFIGETTPTFSYVKYRTKNRESAELLVALLTVENLILHEAVQPLLRKLSDEWIVQIGSGLLNKILKKMVANHFNQELSKGHKAYFWHTALNVATISEKEDKLHFQDVGTLIDDEHLKAIGCILSTPLSRLRAKKAIFTVMELEKFVETLHIAENLFAIEAANETELTDISCPIVLWDKSIAEEQARITDAERKEEISRKMALEMGISRLRKCESEKSLFETIYRENHKWTLFGTDFLEINRYKDPQDFMAIVEKEAATNPTSEVAATLKKVRTGR